MEEYMQIKAKRGNVVILVSLYKNMQDLYPISELINRILEGLRQDINTWFSIDVYNKINPEILIEDTDDINAFATKYEDKHIIALSRGLIQFSYMEIIKWIKSPEFYSIYKLSDSNRDSYIEYLYRNMICFVIAHEMGHIADGHIEAQSGMFCYIDELSEIKKLNNWESQLREYDADCFATRICSLIRIQEVGDDKDHTIFEFDNLGVVLILTFNLLSNSRKQYFEQYLNMEIASIDHPHPGIRMRYCMDVMLSELLKVWSKKDVLDIFKIIYDGIIRTDKFIYNKKEYKDCIYSVSATEKGAQHIMNLVNGWNESIERYEEYAYIPLNKTEFLKSYPVFVDNAGDFL